ncbi:MAG: small multi-drug export protein [Candidatus Komeilibacteria bacterium]
MISYIILKPYLIALWMSVLPVTELRAAIPFVLSYYGGDPILVFAFAVIGNIIPAFAILWGLDLINKCLQNPESFIKKTYNWVLARTRKKTEDKVLQYGYLALLLFVAIPLPGTGAWTGSLAAWLFGLPKKKSFLVICLGVVLSGIIVTLLTTGAINIAK